jgi:hypothetical protein
VAVWLGVRAERWEEMQSRGNWRYRRSSVLWGIEQKSQFPRHSDGASSPALGPTIAC